MAHTGCKGKIYINDDWEHVEALDIKLYYTKIVLVLLHYIFLF
jgi:hypothetical protein